MDLVLFICQELGELGFLRFEVGDKGSVLGEFGREEVGVGGGAGGWGVEEKGEELAIVDCG